MTRERARRARGSLQAPWIAPRSGRRGHPARRPRGRRAESQSAGQAVGQAVDQVAGQATGQAARAARAARRRTRSRRARGERGSHRTGRARRRRPRGTSSSAWRSSCRERCGSWRRGSRASWPRAPRGGPGSLGRRAGAGRLGGPQLPFLLIRGRRMDRETLRALRRRYPALPAPLAAHAPLAPPPAPPARPRAGQRRRCGPSRSRRSG